MSVCVTCEREVEFNRLLSCAVCGISYCFDCFNNGKTDIYAHLYRLQVNWLDRYVYTCGEHNEQGKLMAREIELVDELMKLEDHVKILTDELNNVRIKKVEVQNRPLQRRLVEAT
jgi:hypothetical protein